MLALIVWIFLCLGLIKAWKDVHQEGNFLDWIEKPYLLFGLIFMPSTTAWAVGSAFTPDPQLIAIAAAIAFLFSIGLVITTNFSEN